MTTISSSIASDIARAIESRDADGIVRYVGDDVTFTLYDRDHPPSAPTVFAGRAAVEAYFRDICGRNLEHQVSQLVESASGFSYVQRCHYPSGERVVCIASATTRDGRITQITGVEVWDD